MKHAKRIGSFICVIAICFTLMSASSAHAGGLLGGQQLGALIAAGLASLNIIGQSILPAPGPVDPYFQWLSSPASQTQIEYSYPVQPSILSNYLNAATIKVDQGVTTIDGVVYDELWIEPGTFLHGLKTNLFDFKTKWSILSGQTGTLASGWGFVQNVPVYQVGNNVISQTYKTPSSVGEWQVGNYTLRNYTEGSKNRKELLLNGSSINSNSTFGNSFILERVGSKFKASYYAGDVGSRYPIEGYTTSGIDQNQFQFDYVSGVVPAQESDIPEEYGLSLKIPHDQLQAFYNTYPQYNVDNSTINIQQDEIDVDELVQAIFDQIKSMEDIKAEWNEGPVEPEPEPEPPAPVEDVIEGLNVITQQQFEQMQQQTQIQQQQQQIQQQQLQEQQQISQNTSEINDTIKDVTATPDAEKLPDFKFDLRELFPFCIPFDIYRLLSSFDAEPQAPHVQLPIVIESINFRYNLDLDFSVWDPVAQAMRTAELIVYAIGLAWATGKVIKW